MSCNTLKEEGTTPLKAQKGEKRKFAQAHALVNVNGPRHTTNHAYLALTLVTQQTNQGYMYILDPIISKIMSLCKNKRRIVFMNVGIR